MPDMKQQQMMSDQLRQQAPQGGQPPQGAAQDPQAAAKVQQFTQMLSQMSTDDLYMIQSLAGSILQQKGAPPASSLMQGQGEESAENAQLPPNGAA